MSVTRNAHLAATSGRLLPKEPMGWSGRGLAATLTLLFGLTPTAFAAGDPTRGLNLVTTNCARCHSVTKAGPSPLPEAPEFRSLHLRYPVEDLAESLAEGISTGHADMPEFKLDPDQISDVLVYLKTLEP
jgi:cytochrome c